MLDHCWFWGKGGVLEGEVKRGAWGVLGGWWWRNDGIKRGRGEFLMVGGITSQSWL